MPKTTSKPDARRAVRRRPTNTTLVLIGAGVALVATVAIVAVRMSQAEPLPGERFASQGNAHIADIGADHPTYNSDPPTSGWHVGSLAAWGVYDYVVPDELVIHNMEDGGVILWYVLGTPDQNQERIGQLQDVARGYRNTIIAPREGMPSAFALTAWQRLQRFDTVEPEAMRAFLDAFEGVDHHN